MDGLYQGPNPSVNPSVIPSVMNSRESGLQNEEEQDKNKDEEQRLKALSMKLLQKGRQEDVARAVSNEDYRQALYDEFEL